MTANPNPAGGRRWQQSTGCAHPEKETRQHPIATKAALEKATGKPWKVILLWSRPVKGAEGEGPVIGENPWEGGWPVNRLDDDALRSQNLKDTTETLLTACLAIVIP